MGVCRHLSAPLKWYRENSVGCNGLDELLTENPLVKSKMQPPRNPKAIQERKGWQWIEPVSQPQLAYATPPR